MSGRNEWARGGEGGGGGRGEMSPGDGSWGGEPEAVQPGRGRRTIDRRAFVRTGLGAILPPLLTGCLPGPSEPVEGGGESSARLSVTPGDPIATPVTGVSWLDINPTGRDATMYVPESLEPGVPAPLLVALHGAGGGASDWDALHASCEEHGFVLLAVESRSFTWDRVSGAFGPDVFYMDIALQYVFDRCLIDPDRIGLAGFSDGASYALSLGPSNGDIFRHLVAFSPGFAAPGALVGTPRIWVSHGRQDAVLQESVTRSDIVPSFRDAGYEVMYRSFEGGHEVPREVWTEALGWFLA